MGIWSTYPGRGLEIAPSFHTTNPQFAQCFWCVSQKSNSCCPASRRSWIHFMRAQFFLICHERHSYNGWKYFVIWPETYNVVWPEDLFDSFGRGECEGCIIDRFLYCISQEMTSRMCFFFYKFVSSGIHVPRIIRAIAVTPTPRAFCGLAVNVKWSTLGIINAEHVPQPLHIASRCT